MTTGARTGGEATLGRLLEGVTWYKQAAFRWRLAGLVIYVDPWGLAGDLPQADLVLVTHAHFDHFSKEDIQRVSGRRTTFVAPHDVARELSGEVKPVRPGDRIEAAGVKLRVVPAYNVVEGRRNFHPKKNNWVGYVAEFGGQTYYHAGDTDHLPELETVRADAAFLPIGGTYTMDVGEAAALAKRISPRVAVPMHFGFVQGVGRASDGERFQRDASPVAVEVLTPLVPFANR